MDAVDNMDAVRQKVLLIAPQTVYARIVARQGMSEREGEREEVR